ncbi:hypothetical protein EU527_16925 [Candidatus Thorarchaeota archaeon]|nr:MAG: hypothetical protein EU527_16925 [Candidatus Thorarchaeota archaeon]
MVSSFRIVTVLVLAIMVLAGVSATLLAGSTENSVRTHYIPSDSSSAPIIEWFGPAENSTEYATVCWDGAYTGQTQEVWSFEVWVHDTDGVDCVLFRFLCGSNSEWENKTTERIEGNSTSGLYAGNLTYSVEWNSEYNSPAPEYNIFIFKVFANDSLGKWAETTTITYMGGYIVIFSPSTSTTTTINNPDYQLLLVAAGASGVIFVIVLVLRLKRA